MSRDLLMRPGYTAQLFRVLVDGEEWKFSGTRCGHIDMATPDGTFVLTPEEAGYIIAGLRAARADVLAHAEPVE